MQIQFSKMHGLGNDFVVIDNVTQNVFFSKEKIQQIADRNFGIGFDQLLLVEPPYDPEQDFHYRILMPMVRKFLSVAMAPDVLPSL